MKKFITPYIYNYAKKIMPKISETEAAALNSGTVSIDGNIFNGNLKIKDLTGAGDLFAAGYLHGVINQLNVKECLIKGTELSSKIIQKIGARI